MSWRDRALVLLAGALARGAVLAWAADRVGPAADGVYYHKLAVRLAEGAGYTWLWPDGVVTYAAHYPVGYPWLLSLVYRVAGPHAWAGGLLNALVGLLGVLAVHDLALRSAGRRAGLVAGLIAALDPALVLYTPALMTEGVTASLLAVAAALAAVASGRADAGQRRAWLLGAGAVLGLCTLIRPQCLLVAPLLGFAAAVGARKAEAAAATERGWGALGRGALGALGATAAAVAVCLPWTARNCVRMKACALVSVNGGWNLLIGASPKATGHWSPVDVPPACREVFDEAGKDACFGQAAREMIAHEPGRWLSLIPAKLAATFDYCGAGPWYLHEAAREAFPYEAKVAAGAFETLVHRGLLAAAAVALASGAGRWPWARRALGGAAALLALMRPGWLSYAALAALAAVSFAASRSMPAAALAAALGSTIAVHAAFFGAGRYGLVVFPLLAACAGAVLTGLPPRRDTGGHAPD